MKRVILVAVALAFSTAAFAQTTEFYVVQDKTTKKCTIVDKKPTTTTTVVQDQDGSRDRHEDRQGLHQLKTLVSLFDWRAPDGALLFWGLGRGQRRARCTDHRDQHRQAVDYPLAVSLLIKNR
jgi:hypothetical protein